MKKIFIVLAILPLSFLATLVSVKYERAFRGVVGNVCDVSVDNPHGFCYEDLPRGGFPFSYLFDQGGVQGEGILEGVDDTFKTGWFIADFIFYFIIFLLIVLVRKKFIIKG